MTEKVQDDKFLTRATLVGQNEKGPEENTSLLIPKKKQVYNLLNGTKWRADSKLFPAGFARKWNIRGAISVRVLSGTCK